MEVRSVATVANSEYHVRLKEDIGVAEVNLDKATGAV